MGRVACTPADAQMNSRPPRSRTAADRRHRIQPLPGSMAAASVAAASRYTMLWAAEDTGHSLAERSPDSDRRARPPDRLRATGLSTDNLRGVADTDTEPVGHHAPAISRVGVLGLWHLGSVTAACLAESGLEVVGADPDPAVIASLSGGAPPVAEPGLAGLLAEVCESGRLRFENLRDAPLRDVDAVWIAFDTPVDDEDQADAGWVLAQAHAALLEARAGALVVVSSQLPVGSTASLAQRLNQDGREDLDFACVPENLRLGEALSTFRSPDRLVAGVRHERDRERLAPLLGRFSERIEWMGVESAEMTKHALNAFLATSVAYINEIASLCEAVGADASEVSRGLKSDRRIGARAYLTPGDMFAGGRSPATSRRSAVSPPTSSCRRRSSPALPRVTRRTVLGPVEP